MRAAYCTRVRLRWKADGHHASTQRCNPNNCASLLFASVAAAVGRCESVHCTVRRWVVAFELAHTRVITQHNKTLRLFRKPDLARPSPGNHRTWHAIQIVQGHLVRLGTKSSVLYCVPCLHIASWTGLRSLQGQCHWAPTRVMIQSRSGLDRWATVAMALGVGLQSMVALPPKKHQRKGAPSSGHHPTGQHLAPATPAGNTL